MIKAIVSAYFFLGVTVFLIVAIFETIVTLQYSNIVHYFKMHISSLILLVFIMILQSLGQTSIKIELVTGPSTDYDGHGPK